ncbi:uncharacterized protein DUF3168 [Novosphingobium kunmingense]|uniref:Uncharacterized protein DUF3168 n=1 Tax=Novosphingobium kunmingense TaxID=1211806 RepID=A0A2N0HL61_9SPHN|nr:DUF3168 domain-containing protein [Novosphingobium kunmingense]PKB19656.1 uncharacterized protein DUF3168 [Novosphingobium kunmingense]
MDWEQALRQRLLDDAGCAALLGSFDGDPAVFWTERPQGAPYPSLVLTVVSDPRPQTLKGFQGNRESRVQVDCRDDGATRGAVKALREAAIAALAGPFVSGGVRFGRSQFGPVRDLSEKTETGFVHRDSFDALIWHD